MDNLIPAPVRSSGGGADDNGGDGSGAFLLDGATTLTAGPGTGSTERWLRTTLGAAFGLPLAQGTPADEPANTIDLRIDATLEREGYRLSVAPGSGVRLTGGSAAGVFWGRRRSVSSSAPTRSAGPPCAPVRGGPCPARRSRTARASAGGA